MELAPAQHISLLEAKITPQEVLRGARLFVCNDNATALTPPGSPSNESSSGGSEIQRDSPSPSPRPFNPLALALQVEIKEKMVVKQKLSEAERQLKSKTEQLAAYQQKIAAFEQARSKQAEHAKLDRRALEATQKQAIRIREQDISRLMSQVATLKEQLAAQHTENSALKGKNIALTDENTKRVGAMETAKTRIAHMAAEGGMPASTADEICLILTPRLSHPTITLGSGLCLTGSGRATSFVVVDPLNSPLLSKEDVEAIPPHTPITIADWEKQEDQDEGWEDATDRNCDSEASSLQASIAQRADELQLSITPMASVTQFGESPDATYQDDVPTDSLTQGSSSVEQPSTPSESKGAESKGPALTQPQPGPKACDRKAAKKQPWFARIALGCMMPPEEAAYGAQDSMHMWPSTSRP